MYKSKRHLQALSALLLFAALFVASTAFGRDHTYRGRAGERCSQMCPKAEAYAEAQCEEEGKTVDVKSCECDEQVKPPTAYVIYGCR